jgi:hypothetical protein
MDHSPSLISKAVISIILTSVFICLLFLQIHNHSCLAFLYEITMLQSLKLEFKYSNAAKGSVKADTLSVFLQRQFDECDNVKFIIKGKNGFVITGDVVST